MATASWDGWLSLEREAGTALLTRTGGLYGGPTGSAIVDGARVSAAGYGLAHEVLDAAEIHRRWPVLEPADDTMAIIEEQAGTIRIDRAIEAQLVVAEQAGGRLEFGRRMVNWRPAVGGGFEVETADGQVAGGEHLVLTTGPWMSEFVPDLRLILKVEREVPMWFRPIVDPTVVGADRLPIWVLRDEGTMYYGIPHDPELGLKVSIHHWGTFAEPDAVERKVGPEDVARVRAFLRRRMPVADGELANARVCLYTNTPDETFVIDRHPAASGVAFASACSGHGFKFAPVIGEILADLVTDGSTAWPIERFRASRFSTRPA
jgi:sarcosine oxidase